jgi:acyl transferase domain-containing protein/predicted O-methyltransferase YrrM
MLPMFSSVQPGSIRDPAHLNAHYWRENLESPVLFQGAVHDLLTASGSKNHIFVEIGPHPLLAGPCQQIAKGTGTAKEPPTLVYIPTVRRNEVTTANATNAHTQILEAVATAHCNGVLPTIDLRRATGPGLALTDLPRYPWDHGTRYWLANRMVTDWRMGSAPRHELLGRRVTDSSDAEPLWRNLFFLQEVEWLEEHVLAGQVLFPAAGYIAMAGEAVQQLHPEGQGYSIRKVVFKAALILTEFNPVEMITALKPVRLNDLVTSDWYAFTISAHDGTAWTTHCHGEVRPGFDFPPKARTGNIKRSLRRRVDAARWYQVLRNRGLEYGARFRGLKDVTADPIQRTCIAGVTDTIPTPESGHSLHPVVIDQCLQAMSVAWANGIGRRLVGMGIPLAIEKLYVHAARETMTVDVQVAQAGHNKQLGQATLLSSEGEVLLSMGDAVFFSVDNQLALGATPLIPLASEIRWAPDIDLLPASSLTRMTDMDAKTQKAFHDCILASQLAIWLTEERLRDVSPAAPHMVKWKAWVGEQAARIRRGEAMFVEEMRAFRAKPHEQQEAEVQSMTERYSSDDQWKGCSHTIQAVYDNCVALAKGETTAIDLLLAGNHLKDYYRAVQARFDWTQFLPALGHGNPRLRVLEIGAGTGSATAAVLESLRTPEGARLYSQYAFTDISPGLITAAREEFQHPGIDFSVLDITKDPEEQGFRPHAYDLVIAGNVLHATPKLGDTLRHVRKLLAPGGWLLLQELTTPGKSDWPSVTTQ